MTDASIIQNQVGIGFLAVWLIQKLKSLKWFPWITHTTDRLNRLLSAVIAALAAVGITWQYEPNQGVLTISGLTVASALSFLWTLLTQGAVQEVLYRVAFKPGSNGNQPRQ
jgi:hypothetical protein